MTLHIAYTFDSHYQQHFGASVTSLLVNAGSHRKHLSIHVVTEVATADFEDKLQQLRQQFQVGIHVYAPSVEQRQQLAQLPLRDFYTHETYLNMLLAQILPDAVDRVLYLDADTIVLNDISELFAEDTQGKTIAAVRDSSQTTMIEHWAPVKAIPLYFNSGVMLINLQQWREREYTKRCIEFSVTHFDRLLFLDQCAMNLVLAGDVHCLPLAWNYFVSPLFPVKYEIEPKVLHYIGVSKPWQSWYDEPRGAFYWDYIALSPWANSKPDAPQNIGQAKALAQLYVQQGKMIEAVATYELLVRSLEEHLQAKQVPK
jgi:lipopolysaccharide biosynthesis glycosyltransferase